MSRIVVYDACVLFPAPLRDLMIRVAMRGLVQAKWTEQILDECFASILKERPDLVPAALERTRQLMIASVPDCLVEGHLELVLGLELPDPDDRHVLAAAIHSQASAIVTANLKDFPRKSLAAFGIETLHPDELVLELFDERPGDLLRVIEEQAAALKSPPRSLGQVLDALERNGLSQSAAALRDLLGP